MREIKEYAYPYQENNSELMVSILNSQSITTESYTERSENCHIAKGVEESRAVQKFIKWIEETTDTTLEDIWGVWYRDGGGIKWHTHSSEDDINYSFVYYIQVPDGSSSLNFSKDPAKAKEEEPLTIPINQGICIVWDKDLPHCVPPSNHLGRCVISGNLK